MGGYIRTEQHVERSQSDKGTRDKRTRSQKIASIHNSLSLTDAFSLPAGQWPKTRTKYPSRVGGYIGIDRFSQALQRVVCEKAERDD